MRAACILAFILTFFCLSFASAQEITRYLTIEPPAPWVNPVDRPKAEFPLAQDREISHLLVDNQIRYGEADTNLFLHYAEQLLTPGAVEENSSLSITFDPSYQVVSFHHLHRVRDGVVTDILDPSLFDMYRAEVDREKLIYNGELVLAYLVPDVRVGDILDYSYSIHGRNPALGSNFSGRIQLQYGVPVQSQYKRVVIPAGTDVQFRSFGEPPNPAISDLGNETEYLWTGQNIPGIEVDGNLPESYVAYPTTYLSSYDSWKSVGAHFAPYYDVSKVRSAELQQIASDIRANHVSDKERLRAALDFVQREIRYLGIEIGPGGFVPRLPDQVLRNRFGDCKDMVVLLTALLAELDIQATPVLVDFDIRGDVEIFPPSHSAFDHVIVSATIAGTTYYLDPTRGVQLGDLDHLQQANFGKGLVVAADGPGIVTIKAPEPEFYRDFTDSYDVVSDPDAVLLTSVSRYRMGSADSMLSWYKQAGAAAVNKSFLEYYQNLRPQTEAISDLQLDINETTAEVVITGRYRIPDAWSEGDTPGALDFYADTGDLLHDMPKFIGASRTMPYSLSHPVRTRQSMRFILDDTWEINNAQESIDQPAFEYRRTDRFVDDIYTKEVTYISKSDRIEADDFGATMGAIKNARNDTQVALTINPLPAPGGYEEWVGGFEDNTFGVFAYFALAALVSLIGAILLRNRDIAWREYQVYHPISLTKFVVMTIGTIGIYPVFWCFKNWQWVRDVDAQPVLPFWRALFSPITNFDLFTRMARTTQGNNWFQRAAVLLAAILLVGDILSWFGDELEADEFDWLFLISCVTLLAWLPVVAQVNKLNTTYPEITRKNSRFGWPALAILGLFLPFWVMIIFASLEPVL
ncbi:DUF3857 domain-containing transglutaminase family protein [Ruegeria sp.]|uniref:DUF3857 domain-containing transglutaminase family protein n=1 Tax=Ruegeria sp. TaxID=1879320 RepID=UPI00232807C8|nr:DUF3857 domain-containing transglutaminase family protein [Ruegeria sp.]MDA7965795.1 DUF3857 domain-containing transglutaminase family protein [Ruegeria sp.]